MLSPTTKGYNTFFVHSIGGVIQSTSVSARWSARDFGTISPTTMWK